MHPSLHPWPAQPQFRPHGELRSAHAIEQRQIQVVHRIGWCLPQSKVTNEGSRPCPTGAGYRAVPMASAVLPQVRIAPLSFRVVVL